jgi:hypothetical protein
MKKLGKRKSPGGRLDSHENWTKPGNRKSRPEKMNPSREIEFEIRRTRHANGKISARYTLAADESLTSRKTRLL